MKIKKIKVKGFRGFNKEQEISLDADVVLVYGINGSGKSSFTEAIEWLFFDDISRRRLSPCPGEYSSGIYLINLYYTESIPPFVEVTLEDDKKQLYIIRKEFVNEREHKKYVNGIEVKDFSSLPVDITGHHRPMLAQVEISALVNTEQKDRWEQLSRILGQEELTILRTDLINLRSVKKDDEYKKDEEYFRGLYREAETYNLSGTLKQSLKELDISQIRNEIRICIATQLSKKLAGTLEENIKIIIAQISGSELGKRIADLIPIDTILIQNKITELKNRFQSILDLSAKVSNAKLKKEEIDFFKAGIKLTQLPTCPFCLKRTLSKERIEEINQALETDKEAIESRSDLTQLINDDERFFSELINYFSNTLPNQNELKIISQKLGEINLNDYSGQIKKYEEKISQAIKEYSAKLKLLYDGFYKSIEDYYFHKKKVDLSSTQNALFNYLKEIENSLVKLNDEWLEIRDSVLTKFSIEPGQQDEEMKKWMLLERCLKFIRNKEEFIKKYKIIETVTKNIQKKLENFEKKEVEKLLLEHSEEIKDYYNKLNPGETIKFKKIEVREGLRRQAKLVAEGSGNKEINPVTIFSEAHVNSLSLSIYFPQRVDRNPTWKTIILDDPVQSMDENHSRSLIEILANKSDEKQVIVLTHSIHFAGDFFARFQGVKKTLYYEFINGDHKGIRIEVCYGETKDHLNFVKKNCNGSRIEREQAANALRKAIEAAIGEILIKKRRTLEQVRKWTRQGFHKLFDQLERTQIDKNDIAKLRSLLDQSHSDSHAWSIRDTSKSGLLQGCQNVDDVYKKYLI